LNSGPARTLPFDANGGITAAIVVVGAAQRSPLRMYASIGITEEGRRSRGNKHQRCRPRGVRQPRYA
jgi:hypothetical protein